jgi:hypothetical protein
MDNERRYTADENGTPVRPHRVFDTHKRQTMIYTADPVIAQRMAEDYEKQWLRSTRWRRAYKRVGRFLRSLRVRRTPPPPAVPLTEREQRLAFVEELCETARQQSVR